MIGDTCWYCPTILLSPTGSAPFMKAFFICVLIALPWLNPFSLGPSPAVVPWLVSMGSLALLLPWLSRAVLREWVARAWLMAALISAVFGLFQYFGIAAMFDPWINVTEAGEAFANLRQRNQFATLTNIGLAALLCWSAHGFLLSATLDGAQRLGARPQRRWLAMLAAILLALGNAASSSRTGVVQLGLLLAMTWVWGLSSGCRQQGRQDRWLVLWAAVLAYVAGSLLLPTLAGVDSRASGILARLHEGDPQCVSRLTLWSNVIHLIQQKPWLGWGWGELDYAHFITLYPGHRFCDILDNAHNLPLHLAVELGVPVSVALSGISLWLVWRAKPWRDTDPARQLAWTVVMLILLHSMLEYPLWYGPFQLAFGFSVFLLWPTVHESEVVPARRSFRALALVPALAVILGIGVAYAGWDYRRISQIYLSPAQRAPEYRVATLEKIRASWLFRDQVRFAELTMSPLTTENAAFIHEQALDLLHFSPEARIVEKLIDSAALLGHEQEKQFYLARLRAAFPENYAQWMRENSAQTALDASIVLDRP